MINIDGLEVRGHAELVGVHHLGRGRVGVRLGVGVGVGLRLGLWLEVSFTSPERNS